MNDRNPSDRERRVELARKAFKEFYAQCFWSSDPDHLVMEADLPWIIRNLRQNGGHRGYRVVAELQPEFRRALVARDGAQTKIEWVQDAMFRFLPIEPDAELGWRLNFWDAATKDSGDGRAAKNPRFSRHLVSP